MKNFWNICLRWSRERFPIPAVLLYSGAQFYMAYFFGGRLPDARPPVLGETLAGWALLFLMLLRLRIADEQKDFHQDVQAYPERLLSRGIITMRHLWKLFACALAAEIALCVALGWPVLVLWAAINAWFFLMGVEFFAPKFLNAHIGWYLVTHQLLVPVFAILPLAMRANSFATARAAWLQWLPFLAALMCGTMTYEIARKTWAPNREHPHAVSYTRSWGIPATVAVNQVFAWTCSGLLIMLMVESGTSLAAAPMLAANAVFLAVELRFWRTPTPAWSKRVEFCGAIAMFVFFACATWAFALAGT